VTLYGPWDTQPKLPGPPRLECMSINHILFNCDLRLLTRQLRCLHNVKLHHDVLSYDQLRVVNWSAVGVDRMVSKSRNNFRPVVLPSRVKSRLSPTCISCGWWSFPDSWRSKTVIQELLRETALLFFHSVEDLTGSCASSLSPHLLISHAIF